MFSDHALIWLVAGVMLCHYTWPVMKYVFQFLSSIEISIKTKVESELTKAPAVAPIVTPVAAVAPVVSAAQTPQV